MLTRVDEGLWTTTTPVRFFGMPMPATTTVARLSDGGLFVCSPGAIDDALADEVAALGEVRALVAPNRFHHLFVLDWAARFPGASVHVPESLVAKRPDLAEAERLGEEAPEVYAADVAQRRMRGLPAIDETWFFHRPTRTLIDTDLMHHMQDEPRFFARMGWRMMGAYQRFGPSLMERVLTRDRAALRESVEASLEWGFERVVVAHGDVLEAADAKDRVRASWGWLLG